MCHPDTQTVIYHPSSISQANSLSEWHWAWALKSGSRLLFVSVQALTFLPLGPGRGREGGEMPRSGSARKASRGPLWETRMIMILLLCGGRSRGQGRAVEEQTRRPELGGTCLSPPAPSSLGQLALGASVSSSVKRKGEPRAPQGLCIGRSQEG